jgi:hypothetical protein
MAGTPGTAGSVRSLAGALGLSKSQVDRFTREPWWPARGPDGWNVEACRAAYSANVNARKGLAAPAPTPQTAPTEAVASTPVHRDPGAASAPVDERAKPHLEALRAAGDPLDGLRAAYQLAALRLAAGMETGAFPARAIGDLTRTVEELRRTEAAVLEQRQARGELVETATARALLEASARRFNAALERLETRVAAQVEQWVADPQFRAAGVEERAATVRAAVRALTRQARTEEGGAAVAEELRAAVAAELERRDG